VEPETFFEYGVSLLINDYYYCRQKRTQALFGVGGVRHQFAMNPMLHRTIMRKSITFAYVQLRGNKSKVGLRSLSDKTCQTLTLHRYGTNEQCGTKQ